MLNTFDNGFQLSFLFRDGIIGFEYDQHQMPAIRWISEVEQKKSSGENKQFIAKLNSKIIAVSISSFEIWPEDIIILLFVLQEMVDRYKIVEPMLNIERELYNEHNEL